MTRLTEPTVPEIDAFRVDAVRSDAALVSAASALVTAAWSETTRSALDWLVAPVRALVDWLVADWLVAGWPVADRLVDPEDGAVVPAAVIALVTALARSAWALLSACWSR